LAFNQHIFKIYQHGLVVLNLAVPAVYQTRLLRFGKLFLEEVMVRQKQDPNSLGDNEVSAIPQNPLLWRRLSAHVEPENQNWDQPSSSNY
jgi:hypothetical protein